MAAPYHPAQLPKRQKVIQRSNICILNANLTARSGHGGVFITSTPISPQTTPVFYKLVRNKSPSADIYLLMNHERAQYTKRKSKKECLSFGRIFGNKAGRWASPSLKPAPTQCVASLPVAKLLAPSLSPCPPSLPPPINWPNSRGSTLRSRGSLSFCCPWSPLQEQSQSSSFA